MEKPEKVALNVTIVGRKYQYRVEPELEDLVRSAVRDVTEKLAMLKSKYKFSDNQDALAIVLLQYVTQMSRYKREDVSGTIIREIQNLDAQIDDYVKRNIEE
ncbi:MAG: cell division protein ZapA [Bacteroidales bacterium]|nr:cell division protein ZapA [Bacteroidales bacterium]